MSIIEAFAKEFQKRDREKQYRSYKKMVRQKLKWHDRVLYDLFLRKKWWTLFHFWFKNKIKYEFDMDTNEEYVIIYGKKYGIFWGYNYARKLQ